MSSYRDDREALRAKAARLEKELAEARRQLTDERRADKEVDRLQAEVHDLRKEARERGDGRKPSTLKELTSPTQLSGPKVVGIILVVILTLLILLTRK